HRLAYHNHREYDRAAPCSDGCGSPRCPGPPGHYIVAARRSAPATTHIYTNPVRLSAPIRWLFSFPFSRIPPDVYRQISTRRDVADDPPQPPIHAFFRGPFWWVPTSGLPGDGS